MEVFDFYAVNIRDYIREAGEEFVNKKLSSFSCPINHDIELFLKKNAIEFTKKHQSVTYLVLSMYDDDLLAYFTVAIKPLSVRRNTISNTAGKKLLRVSKLDEESNAYSMAAYLIAQLGKNYTNNNNEKIAGQKLIELALEVIQEVQYAVGGIAVFLEAENHEELLSFYRDNNFKIFGTRLTSGADPHELIQLLRLL